MKTITIGLPCTPSKHISSDTINVTEFLVSWGGGMGGANKKYYATNFKKEGAMFNLDLIDGTSIEVGEGFVVHKKNKKVVKVVTDTTAHVNYHKNVCKKAIQTEMFLLELNEDFAIDKHNYIATHDSPLRDRKIGSDLEKV